jgi:predicted ABC-type ATPase
LGYTVELVFLSLPSPELAVCRVRSRVAQGGHDVPEPVIRRRFDAGLENLGSIYKSIVNSWMLCDNSGPLPKPIASGDNP